MTLQDGAPPATTTVGDRYRLDEVIGRGSSGTVWRGYDARLERPVAIKEIVFTPGADGATARARAQREALTAARVNHPSAVALYDAIAHHDRLYLVLELVEAPNLQEVVSERGPCPAEDVAAMGLALCDALAAAHAAGIVHRDVTPGNVLFPGNGAPPKLTDFGVAAVVDDPAITTTGFTVGSPAYMAPEQATGEPVTAATDVWALGATLYFALEGHAPFERPTAMATLQAVVNEPPAATSGAGPLPQLTGELMAKNPADRPTVDQARRRLAAAAAALASPAVDGTTELPVVQTAVDLPLVTAAAPLEEADAPAPAAAVARRATRRRLSRQATALLVALLVLLGVAVAAAMTGGDAAPGAPLTPTTSVPTTAVPGSTTIVPPTTAATEPPPVVTEDDGQPGNGSDRDDDRGGKKNDDD